MAPSSPPPSGQTLDHPPSPSPSSDLHHTPESPEPQTSNMPSVKQALASITSASTIESKKSIQAGFPFLSLPPEIRNMIYHYIFASVRDETCWTIYADTDASVVKGFRRKCRFLDLAHHACFAEYKAENGLHSVFEIADNYTHSDIILTCRTIFGEAMPIALSHMHISVDTYFTSSASKAFEKLLANMRQPKGAYLSRLTYTDFPLGASTNHPSRLVQCINRSNIRVGYLSLHECVTNDETYRTGRDPVEDFVYILDGLDHQPARVEWAGNLSYARRSSRLESRRIQFNTAVQAWHEKLAISDAAGLSTAPPTFRDFLPQYIDQSSE
ncbi:hypothetical protein KCU64_g1845, partial [Aureobasidium melanogenum]